MDSQISSDYKKYIKPYICTVLATGVLTYFLLPTGVSLVPSALGLSDRVKVASVVGIYAAASVPICKSLAPYY